MRRIKYFRPNSLIFHGPQRLQFDPAKTISEIEFTFCGERLLLDKIAQLGEKFIKCSIII